MIPIKLGKERRMGERMGWQEDRQELRRTLNTPYYGLPIYRFLEQSYPVPWH